MLFKHQQNVDDCGKFCYKWSFEGNHKIRTGYLRVTIMLIWPSLKMSLTPLVYEVKKTPDHFVDRST